MTETDTIRRVARPRGVLTDAEMADLDHRREQVEQSQAQYREAVVKTLRRGASFNEVSKATGLSKDTLQRWKREVGK